MSDHDISPGAGWLAFTPTATGFTGALSVALGFYSVNDHEVTYLFDVTGTSNATAFTILLPIPAIPASNGVPPIMQPIGQVIDSGVTLTTPGLAFVASGGGTSVSVFKDSSAGNWTASGTKRAVGAIRYPV